MSPSPCFLPVRGSFPPLPSCCLRRRWFADESLRSKGRGEEEVGTGDGCNDRSFGPVFEQTNIRDRDVEEIMRYVIRYRVGTVKLSWAEQLASIIDPSKL